MGFTEYLSGVSRHFNFFDLDGFFGGLEIAILKFQIMKGIKERRDELLG